MMTSWIAACSSVAFATIAATMGAAAAYADPASDEPAGAIEQLLQSGWEVAGYASNADNRSTFILFKNSAQPYLVQCLTGYDVTRTPRVFQNCYKLR
jgi:hypothetical protein